MCLLSFSLFLPLSFSLSLKILLSYLESKKYNNKINITKVLCELDEQIYVKLLIVTAQMD